MECKICCSVLSRTNPFGLLNCGHTFCESCIQNISQNTESMQCPTCQTSFSYDIPKCLPYLPLLTENSDTNEPPSCYSCDDPHSATQKCIDCDDYFCDLTAKFHLRQKLSINHRMISIEESTCLKSAHPYLDHLQFKSCPKHNRPYEFLNLNSLTHNELLCSDCLNQDLSSFRLVRLGEPFVPLIGEKFDQIRILSSQARQHLSNLQEEEVELSSRLGELKKSKDRSLRAIHRVFDSLRKSLEDREREMEQLVEEMSKCLSFALTDECERSRVWQGQLSLLGECVEEMEAWVRSTTSSESQYHSSESIVSTESSLFGSNKGLMVDVCLLEDALRGSLSSSQAGFSGVSEDVSESRERVSKLHDRIKFSFDTRHTSQTQSLFSQGIPGPESLTSSSSRSWSTVPPQHVLSFYPWTNELSPSSPCGLTYSPVSKLFYLADFSEHCIQVFRINPQAASEGKLELEILPHLSTPSLEFPMGVYYHKSLLFIVNNDSHQVLVCREKDGSEVCSLGTGKGSSNLQFHSPESCMVNRNHLYVCDQDNHRIQKFSLPDLNYVMTFGSRGKELGQLSSPSGLAIFNHKLYVADCNNNRLSVFDPDSGRGLYLIGPSLSNGDTLLHPQGLFVSSPHNLLFVSSEHRISVFDISDQCLYSFGYEGSEDGEFSDPFGLIMVDDNLYVVDSENDRIQVFRQ